MLRDNFITKRLILKAFQWYIMTYLRYELVNRMVQSEIVMNGMVRNDYCTKRLHALIFLPTV